MYPASPDGSPLMRDLECKISEQKQEIEHLKKTLDQTRVSSQMNMNHAEEMERELHELKEKMRSSENSSPRDNEHMSALRLENATLRNELFEAVDKSEHLQRTVATLEQLLEDERKLFAELAAEKGGDTTILNHTGLELDHVKAELESVLSELQEKDSALTQLQMRLNVQEEELELQKQELFQKENDIRALEKRLEEEQQFNLASAPLTQAPEFASKGCSLFAEVDDGRRRQEEDMRKLAEKNALLLQMMRKAQEEVRRTQEELQNSKNLGTGTSYDSDFVNQICLELNERKATIARQINTIMLLERQVKAKTVVPLSATVLRSENEDLTERCRMIQMEKAKLFDENRKLDRINGTQKNALRKLEFELKMAQDRLGQALKSRENVNKAKGSPIVEHILNASEVISFAREMPTTPFLADKENSRPPLPPATAVGTLKNLKTPTSRRLLDSTPRSIRSSSMPHAGKRNALPKSRVVESSDCNTQ